MQIQSGDVALRVVFRAGLGVACRVSEDGRVIVLDPDDPPAGRLKNVARAMAMHRLMTQDVPRDKPLAAEFVGAIAASIARSLAHAGGEARLVNMHGGDLRLAREIQLSPSSDPPLMECPICGARIAPGSVKAIPGDDTEDGTSTVRRLVWCGECDAWIGWREHAGPNGRPSGIALDGERPKVLPADEQAALIERWPKACGCVRV